MTTAGAALVDAVRALYERHPYPRYPLLATPRWRAGYLVPSRFAQALATELTGTVSPPRTHQEARPQILIGGAGEILPYIVRKWEPRQHHVISIDVSRRSLRRARWRLWRTLGSREFLHGDLDDYLASAPPESLAHVDAYGVLHHMPNPGRTLDLMARGLVPGGTIRLMVYNSAARRWIHHLQRAFALLHLDPLRAGDLKIARHILALTAEDAPILRDRLSRIGARTLQHDARFADLFMHPREAVLGIRAWFEAIAAARLAIVGLFDRYGELDDLPNPLWRAPDVKALEPRAADLRFENNLELYLTRPAPALLKRGPHAASPAPEQRRGTHLWPLALGSGPALWYDFPETQSIAWPLRARLWRAHLRWMSSRRTPLRETDLAALGPAAVARLARLGAILPGQLPEVWRVHATEPLVAHLDAPPRLADPTPRDHADWMRRLGPLLASRSVSEARFDAAIRRLEAARRS